MKGLQTAGVNQSLGVGGRAGRRVGKGGEEKTGGGRGYLQ